MNAGIALIVSNYGSFALRVMDEYGGQREIAHSNSLEDCLRDAAINLGHPLVIPISGPNTEA